MRRPVRGAAAIAAVYQLLDVLNALDVFSAELLCVSSHRGLESFNEGRTVDILDDLHALLLKLRNAFDLVFVHLLALSNNAGLRRSLEDLFFFSRKLLPETV